MRKFELLTLLSFLLPMLACAYDAEIDGIHYNFSGNEAVVTLESKSGGGYSGVVVIPESIIYNGKTYRVTSIGGCAFIECNITSITIPQSVTSIGNGAFSGCSSLTSITIPQSVTNIGNEAFSGCSSLTSITIPNSVTSIEDGIFANCCNLTSVNIPKSVTSIGDYAFTGCIGLTSITIPKSVNSIGEGAFEGCFFLTDSFVNKSSLMDSHNWGATLSDESRNDGLIIIDKTVVRCRPWVTTVTIPTNVTSIGKSAFADCTSLTSITIPNSVTTIGEEAFKGSSLTSITIPNSVTTIGEEAFNSCNSLSSIALPKDLKSIEAYTFAYCSSLTTFTIPDNVTNIGQHAFLECSSLSSINIPNSVISIGDEAFAWCSNLKSIKLPDNLTSIGSIFSGCSSLTSVTLPESVTSIDGTFYACEGLTSINIPTTMTNIGDRTFCDCSGLTSINIPNSVTSIGQAVFSGCSNLISINIPNSVTSIGSDAFYGCSSLTSITIPNSITSISVQTFRGCCSLSSIEIPNSVTSIGSNAFYDCSKLTSVVLPENVTIISDDAFENCNSLISINVPKKVESFRYLEGTAWYKNQRDGLIYIGKVAYKYKGEMPKATHISIDEGTLKIADKAFYNCNNLTSVTIPSSVTSIDKGTFNGCNNLAYLYIQNSKDKVRIESDAIPSKTRVVYKSPLDNSNEKGCPPILSILKNSLQIKGLVDDNALYSNSKCTLVAQIHNDGERNAQMCVAKVSLQGATSGIKIDDYNINSIEAGKTKEISIPIQTSSDTENGNVTFSLQVIEKNGYNSESASITIPINAHGTNQLSAEGLKHRKAADELVKIAKKPEDLFGAIEEYKLILNTDPSYSDAYYNLAELYKKIGNDLNRKYYSNAKSYYIQFKRLVPEESAEIDDQLYLLERLMKK